MKKEFCCECLNECEYEIKEVEKEVKKYGKIFKYSAKKAYCRSCGSEIIIDDIHDANIKELQRVIDMDDTIVRKDDLEKIQEMYCISKRPLSLVLGFGEQTYSRYLEGEMPSNVHYDILYNAKNDPSFFLQKLQINKDLIGSRVYKNSLAAVQGILGIVSQNKLTNAAKYFIKNGGDITPLALQKMLYEAQGFNMALTGKALFDEDCQAWVHGPVYPDIYIMFKNYKYSVIRKDIGEEPNIDLCDKVIYDAILDAFGEYSGNVLEKITHLEEPWNIARVGLENSDRSTKIISKESILNYFKGVKNDYNILNARDICKYADIMYNKVREYKRNLKV